MAHPLSPAGLYTIDSSSTTPNPTPLDSPISPGSSPAGPSPFIPPTSSATTIKSHSQQRQSESPLQTSDVSREETASPVPSFSTASSSGDSPRNAESPNFDRERERDKDRETSSESSSKGSLRTYTAGTTPRLPINATVAPPATAIGHQTAFLGPPTNVGTAQQGAVGGGTGLGISSHRNRGFTAPTAPSPLARASIVPATSDSEDKSSTESTDDGVASDFGNEGTASGSGSATATVTEKKSARRIKRASPPRRTPSVTLKEGSGDLPTTSIEGSAEAGPGPSTNRHRQSPPVSTSQASSGSPGSSPKLGGRRKERFSLGSPSTSASGLSSSYTYPTSMAMGGTATTPGMILRGKTRQGSGSSVGSNLALGGGATQKSSPTDSDIALGHLPPGIPLATSPRQRTRSGSFGSMLGPTEGRQRSESGSSHVSRMSLLGLTGPTGSGSPDKQHTDGLGLGGMESGADLSRGGSLRDSPGRSRAKTRQSSGGSSMLGESPTRNRRFSEFPGPGADVGARRMSIAGSNMGPPRLGPSASSFIPVSTVSPLNSLPSPWTSTGTDANMSRTPGGADSPMTSGAIRLTRVPESVRQSSHAGSSGLDSPASGPVSLSGSFRLATSPMSDSAMRHGIAAASVPATPAATRLTTPVDSVSPPPELASAPGHPHSRSLSNSPRAQQRGLGRTRPLMPPPSAFGPLHESGTPPLVTPPVFATVGSEPPLQRSPSMTSVGGSTGSQPRSVSPLWPATTPGGLRMPSPLVRARSITSSTTTPHADNVGLGLEMSSNSFASRMSSGALPRARLLSGHTRQVSAQAIDTDALQKDIAGDASRHASMIMQSRKAKMQRWRPGSAGRDTSQDDVAFTKPPMERASSSSELLGLRLPGDRLAAWKMQSGERRDGEAIIDRAPIATEVSPRRHPLHRASYGPHEVELNEDSLGIGSSAMARESSNSESVNGIEWVDWMDEYKRYKAAKLQTEQQADEATFAMPSMPPSAVLTAPDIDKDRRASDGFTARPSESDASSRTSPRNSLQLMPSKSRSSITESLHRHRSSSIRSNASTALTTVPVVKASPPSPAKRLSSTERARHASTALSRSQLSTGKRKKNLANKMEGWWNAVKSNFGGPGAAPHASSLHMVPSLQPVVESSSPARPLPALAPTLTTDRRESIIASPAMPLAAQPRPRWLRSSTSHADLVGPSLSVPLSGLSTATPKRTDTASAAKRSSSESKIVTPPSFNRKSTSSPAAPPLAVHKPIPSGLETRRRQPQLSLKLEQSQLSYPQHFQHHRTASSASGISRDAASMWGSGGMSDRQSSGFPSPFASIAPGTTPALTQWDHRTSPLWAGSNRQVSDSKNGSAASQNGDDANAPVMKLVKHRVAVAKETCDGEIREIIIAITAFVEGHIHQAHDRFDAALEADDDTDLERPMERLSDAFDPDSDTDSGQLGIPIARSRQPSSRSRHGSISLASSPLKRRDFMPSSFKAMPMSGAASPDRRRSSAQRPLARPTDLGQRLSRNLNAAVAKSSASSRSTSRSRSPMPGNPVMNYLNTFESESPVDSGLIQVLQEVITVATDVLDISLNALIARPGVCQEMIAKVRELGLLWDENPDLPGRPWYIRLLLAVAALTRVLDWWGAEKDFWNFDPDHEDESEPLTFVMKPPREEEVAAMAQDELRVETSPAARRHQEPVSASTMSSIGAALPAQSLAAARTLDGMSMGEMTAKPDRSETLGQVEPTEDLLVQAEHAKSVNIVLELSLGEELIEWANPAWQEVIGADPEEAIGTPITAWLAPADVEIVANAGRELEKDDSLTAQARFRLVRITSTSDEEDAEREPGPSYIEFEGIGMLMRDRETGAPSHTMWVIKPVASAASVALTPKTPMNAPAGMLGEGSVGQLANILCRICERDIPLWYFEKHNETCNEVHRLEADIAMINEKLDELKDAIAGIKALMESSENGSPAQYNGQSVFPDSGPGGEMATLIVAVRRLQVGQLDDALAILASTKEISTPSVREESASVGLPQYQGLLSPRSEDKLTMAARWVKPETDDLGLSMILSDLEDLVRQKHMAVNRMRNTILYSERVRQEWEDKMQRMLAVSDESSGGESSGHDKDDDQADDTLEGEPSASVLTTTEDPPLTRPSLPKRGPSRKSTAGLPGRDRSVPRRKSRHGSLGDGSASRSQDLDSSSTDARSSRNHSLPEGSMSPNFQSTVPASKTAAPSIKDFDIIKPISRGAFGSVYLAKKRATGDYFAIKALKKSDMIAKNQITNVKAERTILMNQASSPYVAKLFFSFQNKDFLYLVMEYLNGGDCAALIKTLGGLPEEWARNYIAEVVLGLEYLHERRIVHRDLKPDNLLIDAHGHLKLTDFGLSRIGLLNRQVGGPRPAHLKQTNLHRLQGSHSRSPQSGSLFSSSPGSTPDGLLSKAMNGGQGYFGSRTSDLQSADESSGSESLSGPFPRGSIGGTRSGTHPRADPTAPKTRDVPKFVGTPDYLCPESILGIGADDATVDWWALGVVMYEFIYGFPPFHADTPEKVFDNIISRRINWYEDDMEVSAEGRDLMERLMCSDPGRRLGRNGAAEVKAHAFFAGIDWDTIATVEANFVPNVADPENTEYFDARGAVAQVFTEPEPDPVKNEISSTFGEKVFTADANSTVEMGTSRRPSRSPEKLADEFGQFTFKNLPVLKQANDEVIRKLRSDQVIPSGQSMTVSGVRDRRLSQVGNKRRSKVRPMLLENMPPSPAPSTASSGSVPSFAGNPPRTPATAVPDYKSDQGPQGSLQRSQSQPFPSLPSTLTTSAAREIRKLSGSSSSGAVHNRAVDVLVAEDNPISQKILATLLTRMGCRCVCVNDGAEALSATMGDIRFDLMIFDLVMPNVSGEEAARMIRSTNNPNADTPIIAATSYEHKQADIGSGAIFSAILAKPVTKKDLAECFKMLGFVLGSVGKVGAPVTAVGQHQPRHGDAPSAREADPQVL